ncbi:MAG: hypothetical protein J2P17_12750, partial [Mycobacterium sp.]|nr:hypothetical protein [Mycobacterium sp.]
MRYAQGGGFTEADRRRREQVRLSAMEKFEWGAATAEMAAELWGHRAVGAAVAAGLGGRPRGGPGVEG